MRKRLCALMMIIPLLTSCGAGERSGKKSADELALAIRTEYLAMTTCSATMDIIADYGQRVYEYTISMSWKKDSETLLTVIAPETIAGIKARLKNGTGYLEFEGASLETGVIFSDGLSPIEAAPAILNYILSGFIAECDFETVGDRQQLWFCCRDPQASPGTGTEAAFWFDAESHAVLKAEVYSEGYTVIQCNFTDFTKE